MTLKDVNLKELEAQNRALTGLIDQIKPFIRQARQWRDKFDIHHQRYQSITETRKADTDLERQFRQSEYQAANIRDCHYEVREMEREISRILSGREADFKPLLKGGLLKQPGERARKSAARVVNFLGKAMGRPSVNVDECYRLLDDLADALDSWRSQAAATLSANEKAMRGLGG
jgi:hypothetical protein